MTGRHRLLRVSVVAIGLTLVPGFGLAEVSAPSRNTRSKSNLNTSSESLVIEATRRLKEAVPAEGMLTILLQIGAGEHAAAVGQSLRDQLSRQDRITFSRVEEFQEAPVPDANVPGEHVHASRFIIHPFPTLVVLINESEGKLVIAARDPGPDPLGPPEQGWRWILTEH